MHAYNKIPIKNIYYMLCYAWNRLEEKDMVEVGQDEEKDIYNLLARVLVTKLKGLIKKGFYREYREIHEESSTIRGKLDFDASLKALSFKRAKMFTRYDEISHDILHNQVIKTTLFHLIKANGLDQDLKDRVFEIYKYFHEVSLIRLDQQVFKQVRIHRNNQHYGFTLSVCKLFYDNLLVNEDNSQSTFLDFERTKKQMAYLFESFVRNFYDTEAPEYKVYRENIYWDATGADLDLLPTMQTDISLESSTRKIIMDTKFYQNTLAERFDTKKIISHNLYQIFAYLSNYRKQDEKPLTGILLYPRVDQDVDVTYQIKNYTIRICTVDLNRHWGSIHNRLVEIVL